MKTPSTKRFRRAHVIGSLDPDSDEELEIEESATSTLAGISITHRAYSSKRLKTQHREDQMSTVTSTAPDDQNCVREESNLGEDKKTRRV